MGAADRLAVYCPWFGDRQVRVPLSVASSTSSVVSRVEYEFRCQSRRVRVPLSVASSTSSVVSRVEYEFSCPSDIFGIFAHALMKKRSNIVGQGKIHLTSSSPLP